MQKRHARWIAGIAVAGTVVLTGTAAGAAATVRSPQEISPATCAALAADLASTVAEAAKGLAAPTPDLSAVSDLVAQAKKLQDAFKSLSCTPVPLPVPLPSVPSLPIGTGKPSIPPLPGASTLPSLPGAPISALPSAPALPSLSSVQSAVPSLGNVPGLPPLPQS